MNVLIVICSKSPNLRINMCINALYKIQIDATCNYKVCIIDSDSDDLTQYTAVSTVYPEVEIHFIKNKNYEYGARK